MARALQDIITELNSVYNPQRDSYNQQMSTLDPQLQAEQQGLQAQKQDEFQNITNQANRRGLFYSGLPVQEEQRYVGQQFLPAIANLHAKYATQKFGLQDAIAKITTDQYNQAYGVRQKELDTEEQQREFDRRLAAQQAADEANRRAAAASGGGGGVSGFGGVSTGNTAPQAQSQQSSTGGLTLRQQWQREANAGDWNAQTLLNYVGDNNRYDGPVNSLSEYNILKQHGVIGNYYVPTKAPAPAPYVPPAVKTVAPYTAPALPGSSVLNSLSGTRASNISSLRF